MDPSITLAAWRAATRSPTLAASVAAVARLAARHLPLERLVVRHVAFDRGTIRTLAQVTDSGRDELAQGKVEIASTGLPKSRSKPLLAWCHAGKAGWARDGRVEPEYLSVLLPTASERNAVLLPLTAHQNECGVAILELDRERRIAPENRQLASQLAEPLSAALEIALRADEVRDVRAAAEAERENLLRRLGRDDAEPESIVGADAGLAPVMARVNLVARSHAPVLILGETGAGKEVIARAIHERSPRSEGPFLRVNCGAIAPDLIDSELFGHERGAFTGATALRRGWFERAHGGTLFLDEIGDLPLAAQVRLLRVVQEGVLERVGGEGSLTVDVRLIAATHRDLPAMVQSGKFREDLWYRIAVFPILLPPLRERRGDIPALAATFARRAARRLGVHEVHPSPDDVRRLQRYHWPGNVRELASVMDRAVILGNGETLDVAQALGPVGDHVPVQTRSEPGRGPRAIDRTTSLRLDDAMRAHIERVLRLTEGRIEGPRGAATLLAINPHTLRARMKKLGIPWASFRPPDDLLTRRSEDP